MIHPLKAGAAGKVPFTCGSMTLARLIEGTHGRDARAAT
jgi:hypothetical protein